MQRYQLYLNPTTIAVFDEGERLSNITRSALLRQALERAAEQMITLFSRAVTFPQTKNEKWALDDLVGFIKLPGKKKTNYARRIDEVLYEDHF